LKDAHWRHCMHGEGFSCLVKGAKGSPLLEGSLFTFEPHCPKSCCFHCHSVWMIEIFVWAEWHCID
jgi:hypothetical protein